MGQDKALLPVENSTLLQRTVDIAQLISPQVWIVTPWREAYQPVFSETVQWLDDPHQQGGLVAFRRSLPQLQAPQWVLLLACDLPYLDAQQLQTWVPILNQIPSQYAAALVKQNQRYEPLCGFYRGTVQSSLVRFTTNGGRSFQKWLATEAVYPLSLNDDRMLFNCNSPADFATLKTNF